MPGVISVHHQPLISSQSSSHEHASRACTGKVERICPQPKACKGTHDVKGAARVPREVRLQHRQATCGGDGPARLHGGEEGHKGQVEITARRQPDQIKALLRPLPLVQPHRHVAARRTFVHGPRPRRVPGRLANPQSVSTACSQLA